MTEQDLENARRQAAAQFASIAEMLEALDAAEKSEDDRAMDEAREAIEQDALSVQVRDGWKNPGAESDGPEEYEILLCTGGPAVRIIGRLSEHCEPETAWIQYQDWFTPWADWRGADLPDNVEETLLTYARVFYFGE